MDSAEEVEVDLVHVVVVVASAEVVAEVVSVVIEEEVENDGKSFKIILQKVKN